MYKRVRGKIIQAYGKESKKQASKQGMSIQTQPPKREQRRPRNLVEERLASAMGASGHAGIRSSSIGERVGGVKIVVRRVVLLMAVLIGLGVVLVRRKDFAEELADLAVAHWMAAAAEGLIGPLQGPRIVVSFLLRRPARVPRGRLSTLVGWLVRVAMHDRTGGRRRLFVVRVACPRSAPSPEQPPAPVATVRTALAELAPDPTGRLTGPTLPGGGGDGEVRVAFRSAFIRGSISDFQ